MSALKIGNVLRAGLMAWAMFMDLNVRSGDNYVNISQSLVGTSGAVALAAPACLLALSWADERLPKAGLRVRLAALFLGVWQVIAVSVVNTNDLNQPFLSGSQKLKAAVLALGMASLFELLFRLLEAGLDGRLDLRIQRDGALRRAYRAHTLLFCMAAVLLCWLPHLAVSYPASMNSDTQSQFDQILGLLPWSKHHPTLLAFFLLGTTRLGHALGSGNAGLFAYVLVQAVFAAAVIGYSQWIMRRLCAPVWLRALSLALCAFAPVYCDNITVILKDVPYSYAMLLMLCEMVRQRFLEKEGDGFSAGFVLRMTLSAFLMLRMRPNGAMVWIPICAALFLGTRGRKRRAAIAAVAALPLLLGAGFDAGFDARFHPQAASLGEALSLPFQQTARFVSEYASEVTDEERAAIDGVLVYDELAKRYQPELSDPVKAMYRKTATPRDWLAYGQAWASQMIRHPGCYLSATIVQNALLFDVSTYNLAIFTGTGLSAREEEALDIHRSGTLTRLEKMESSLRQVALALPFALQLNTLGFYCAVLLGTCAIACSRKARGTLTILLPQMLTMAVIFCGPCIEHQDRYGFPVIYLMPLALAALSCALRRTQRN